MTTVQSQPGSSAPPAPAADEAARRVGLAYGLAAYGWWGLIALYFKAVEDASPFELLGHRMIWSVPLLGLLLTLRGRWGEVKAAILSRRAMLTLLLSTALIAVNWFLFIWSVASGRLSEASLGYFINPLVSVALGAIFLGERMRLVQYLCLGLAAMGVVVRVAALGHLPWVALTLAVSFGFYGLMRKTMPVKPIPGLFCEVTLLLPPALGFLIWQMIAGKAAFFGGDMTLTALLPLAGPITVLPLLWFVEAARRLPLSTMGFLQYLAPSGQLLLAVLAFGEPFRATDAVSFGLIWLSLALFSADSVRNARRNRRLARCAEVLEDL